MLFARSVHRTTQRCGHVGRGLAFESSLSHQPKPHPNPQHHEGDHSRACPRAKRPRVLQYRDVTIFNNGTDTPTDGLFAHTANREIVTAAVIVDCRRQQTLGTTIDNTSTNKTNKDPDSRSFMTATTTTSHCLSHPRGEEENIVSALARMMDMPASRASFLVHIGAVYLSAFPPFGQLPKLHASKMPKHQKELCTASRRFLDQAISSNSRKVGKLDSPARVLDATTVVKTGNFIKVGLRPRRSRLAASMVTSDWRQRILYEDDWCVVVDKPAGIPSVPTPDNIRENVSFSVGQMLGYHLTPRQLYLEEPIPVAVVKRCAKEVFPYISSLPGSVTKSRTSSEGEWGGDWGAATGDHANNIEAPESRPNGLMYVVQRLDVGTSGTMMLAKTKHAAKVLQQKLTVQGNSRKLYTALCFSFKNPYETTTVPIPRGVHTHYLDLNARCASTIGGDPVVKTSAFDTPAEGRKESHLEVVGVRPVTLGVDNISSVSGDGRVVQLWEINIELKTGRKHQIRAQLETFGLCCVGDEMYPHLLWGQGDMRMDGRMGLQASRLELDWFGKDGRMREFIAKQPWWKLDNSEEIFQMLDAQLTGIRSQAVDEGLPQVSE